MSLCRSHSLPASWTAAATALAALRTVRPLAEPLTSGAGSRNPALPTCLLLLSQNISDFGLLLGPLSSGHVLLFRYCMLCFLSTHQVAVDHHNKKYGKYDCKLTAVIAKLDRCANKWKTYPSTTVTQQLLQRKHFTAFPVSLFQLFSLFSC